MKKNTSTPGKRIKSLRESIGLDQLGLAKRLGLKSDTSVSKWENDKNLPNGKRLVDLAIVLSTSTDYILYGVSPDDSDSLDTAINLAKTEGVPIPILGEIAAGTPIPAVEDIDVYDSDSYALIGERMAASGTYYGLRIRGASMEPRMFEDDVVIVRQQSMVDSGQIAVVLINGDTATVKQVKFDDNGITLIGFNEDVYPPRHFSIQDVISMPVQIIGRVVEVRGKL